MACDYGSELLRVVTASPWMHSLASGITIETKRFGSLHVQSALLIEPSLQGQSISV